LPDLEILALTDSEYVPNKILERDFRNLIYLKTF